MKKVALFVAAVLGLALVGETAAHVSGVADVPRYNHDNLIGYVPQPYQHRTMLWRYDYAFNDKSMGVLDNFHGDRRRDILLIGDSIVMGVNNYAQQQRLGPRLSEVTGATVWPVGAISWAMQNELEYLRRHPEVVSNVARVIIVSNSADFDKPSSWANPVSHPYEAPTSAVWFLAQKYLHLRHYSTTPENEVDKRNWEADLRGLRARFSGPIDVVLYPDAAEFKSKRPCAFEPASLAAIQGIRITCVADDPRWTAAAYQDEIHPAPAATTVLARIIADRVLRK